MRRQLAPDFLPRSESEDIVKQHHIRANSLAHSRATSRENTMTPNAAQAAPAAFYGYPPYAYVPQHSRQSSGFGAFPRPPPRPPQSPMRPLAYYPSMDQPLEWPPAPPQQTVIYAYPQRPFIGKAGALQMLCQLLQLDYQVNLLVPGRDEPKAVARKLRWKSGWLLGVDFPIVQMGAHSYVQYIAVARVIAKENNMYGHDNHRDYAADAIMDWLWTWFTYQDIAVSAVAQAVGSLWGKGQPKEVTLSKIPQLSLLHQYLEQRPLYYKLLNGMYDSWPHIFRHPTLNVSWIDPLIVARVADDLLMDQLLRHSAFQCLHAEYSFQFCESIMAGSTVAQAYDFLLKELCPELGGVVRAHQQQLDALIHPRASTQTAPDQTPPIS